MTELWGVLIEETQPDGPDGFFVTYWTRATHLGEALEWVRHTALSNGISRPVLRSASVWGEDDVIDCDTESTPNSSVFWTVSSHSFPREETFELPYGVIPTDGEDGLDPGEIEQSYRVTETDGTISVEANVPEGLVLDHYEALLRAHEPFKVFWYVLHDHRDGTRDEFRTNEALDSADAILDHLRLNLAAGVRNGHVTLTAYAVDGATNINISDHKKLVVMTRAAERVERSTDVLRALGYEASEPFLTIDDRMHHWHYRDPSGPTREELKRRLTALGFNQWAPGAKG